ncbi:MAG TPA: glutamate 5-kinase, partial [Burkholderiaceae bacterium]|nr:glutamate 5-kinase [Burkholderiaceae bacterium]
MTSVVANAHRVVVKIGSSSVTAEGRGLDHGVIDSWASQIVALHEVGKQVLLVSSGAIVEGMQRL